MKHRLKNIAAIAVTSAFSFMAIMPMGVAAKENDRMPAWAGQTIMAEFNQAVKVQRKALQDNLKNQKKLGVEGNFNLNVGSLSLPAMRFAMVQGELVAKSSNTLPADLTVKVTKAWPGTAEVTSTPALSVGQTITVHVDVQTRFVRLHWGKSNLAEYSVGDKLEFFGRWNDTNTVLNALLVKDNSIYSSSRVAVGAVTSIDASAQTFTVAKMPYPTSSTMPLTDWTVRTDGETKITGQRGQKLTFADIKVAQHVVVDGVINTDTKTILARSIRVKAFEAVALPFRIEGTLTAMSGTATPATITVQVTRIEPHNRNQKVNLPTDVVTIQVDSRTKVVRKYNGVSSLAELTVGDAIVVHGKLQGDGKIVATTIKDNSIHQTERSVKGTISAIMADLKTFTLQRPATSASTSSTVSVQVTASTKIATPSSTNATFADLQVGNQATVHGVLNERTKNIVAKTVRVLVPSL